MQPLPENSMNIPAFLSKLWRMVNDPETDHLISWSASGNSFIIQNQAQFWYELLPVYYKHNNMSSFVRQLNMYGFHKMSTVENGTMDIEKDENQFYHLYFQRDHPELLKNIKRKVTGTKVSITTPEQNVIKSDDLTKVLSDVKHLRGRQASVDSQLNAMKQENAVLWRELAMLRQKHLKQQQIVNKLIQFLVTIVQPTTRMGGLGVKRHYPLMLSENPKSKKNKKSSSPSLSEGPTIHELDSAEGLPEELFSEEPSDIQTNSPGSESSQKKSTSELLDEVCRIDPISPHMLLDSPELVDKFGNPVLVKELLSDSELPIEDLVDVPTPTPPENFDTLNNSLETNNQKVFLNPSTQDTLLSNLIDGRYNSDVTSENTKQVKKENDTEQSHGSPDLTVARIEAPEYARVNSVTQGTNGIYSEDLDTHVDSTQSEIDQLKDILNGCNSFDANALLGLFNDDCPDYILSYNQNNEDNANKNDPLVSGSELTTYGSGLIDFSQLFDDTSDPQDVQPEISNAEDDDVINTPQVITNVPLFPITNTSSKKGKK